MRFCDSEARPERPDGASREVRTTREKSLAGGLRKRKITALDDFFIHTLGEAGTLKHSRVDRSKSMVGKMRFRKAGAS